jgi:type III pantothenate kinase
MPSTAYPLVAVDVGNNRLKFGLFDREDKESLPEPAAVYACDGSCSSSLDDLTAWLDGRLPAGGRWWIASVNRPGTTRLLQWLQQARPADEVTLLAAGDLPLVVALQRPDMVGIDRLLDAVAANRLRRPAAPAVVVDVGTAITVDLVAADGSFRGGAILPGIAMSARALHTFTDLLPLLDVRELDSPPPPLGTSTAAALQSGLFWGAVGAIRQLLEILPGDSAGPPEVFLTGGAGPMVAGLLGDTARHVPHLTLAGIALAARSASERMTTGH